MILVVKLPKLYKIFCEKYMASASLCGVYFLMNYMIFIPCIIISNLQ